MKPCRILIFSAFYYPNFIGGAEVAVKEITDRINSSSIEFDMVTLGKSEAALERIGNINIHRIKLPLVGRLSIFFVLSKLLYPFLAYHKALELHAKNPYDAIWGVMASYAGYAAQLFKKRHPQVPFILTIQEGDNFERRQGIFHLLFKKIFARADYIQVISKFLAEWSRSMGAKSPIEVIPNGVAYERFAKTINPERRKKIRSDLGFKDADTVLVTASRLVHKNAIDDIIQSLTHLDKSYKALILGTGALLSNLKQLVSKLKLEDRVVFSGFVNHSELPEYLQASDIFVRPSRTEGLGISFLEAMAAGIPVIATPVGGIPDFLNDGETGLFCEVDNPRSIAQKVEKLSKDVESREYIVKRASEMIRDKYDWNSVAASMQVLLKSLL